VDFVVGGGFRGFRFLGRPHYMYVSAMHRCDYIATRSSAMGRQTTVR